MSLKLYSLLLIGVVIGGCVGYVVSLVYTPQFLEDVLPNNYKAQLDDLSQQYHDLSDQYEALTSDVEALQGDYDALEGDHNDLEEDYITLSGALEALTEEHDALTDAHEEALEEYDSLLMQYLIVTGSAPLTPQPLSNDTIRRDFAWVYDGKTKAFSLYIPEHLYLYYGNKTRVPTEDYSLYVTHPYDDEYLSTIIAEFDDIAAEEGYDENQKINLVVSFIQSLPYTSDDITTGFDEYPRYPIETLVHDGGDCEDTSILASALLDLMGFDVVLINLPGHVAIGVAVDAYGTYWLHEGTQYFYVETTGEGWEIGELPEAHQGESAVVFPLLPVPVCTHTWAASTLQHEVFIVADIQNVGTAQAIGIKLLVAFEGEGDVLLNPRESDMFDLDVGEETTVMLKLDEPRNVQTRLVIRILDPFGAVMDESHSAWFDTD
jgi:outer membrane murein-binding lipoprotein Lpp